MHEFVAARDIAKRGGIREFYRVPEKFGIGSRHAAMRSRSETLVVIGPQYAKPGFAQPYGFFEHSAEHRGEIAGRGVDDLEDLGGRGLLLQSLARLGQEPRILDRDDRLIG